MTPTLALDSGHKHHIDRAAQLLKEGELVAIPTETVYGLAADADNESAITQVFAAKQRPIGHPLIVHLAEPERMTRWSDAVPEQAWRLAEAFWPGPLTLLIPRGERTSQLITGASDRVAVRMPGHPVALAVIRALGRELVAPSANPYGRISPTTAAHVLAGLEGRIAAVLDGGPCAVGVESTIIDLAGEQPLIVRPGAIGRDQLEAVLGMPVVTDRETSIAAPGNVKRHYQPETRTISVPSDRLASTLAELTAKGERVGVIWHSTAPGDGSASVSLEMPADSGGYARLLYSALHRFDRENLSRILVEAPPAGESWSAVNDRLRRACAV